MKNNLYKIELQSYNVPSFVEQKQNRWVTYGLDNWFPFYLLDLFNGSSTHNAIITSKVNYIKGRGLTVDNVSTTLERARLDAFIYSPNPYETWQEIFNKIATDYELYNGFALEIKNSKDGRISEVYHIEFSRLRVSKDDNDTFLYSKEWYKTDPYTGDRIMNYRVNTKALPRFNPNKNQSSAVYYYSEYRPNFNYYPLPDYIGSLQAIETQIEISNFDLNSIKNGFAGGTLVNLFNGTPPTEEAKDDIEQKIYEKVAGSNNGNRILVNFADSKETGGVEILSLMGNDLPERYAQLEKRVIDNIFIGHKIVSPMLFGVKTEGQLGGRNELIEAYELFKETYIKGRRIPLLNAINDIFEYKGLRRAIGVEELKPLGYELPLTEQTIVRITGDAPLKDYIAEKYGIDMPDEESNINEQPEEPTQETEQPAQMMQFADEAATDAVLNYLNDKGQPMSNYDIVGEFDVHDTGEELTFAIDERNMEFADPTERTLANAANIIRANKGISITELSKVIKLSVKETEAIVQELMNKKMVLRADNGAMTTTNAALPLIMKLPDPTEVLLVRYRYDLRLDMAGQPKLIKKSRRFCVELIDRDKIYTKDEIEGMRNDMKITFLSDIRDVWRYRGGWYRAKGSDVSVPFCRHIWKQVVVKEKR